MQCITTASFLATAIFAFLRPLRLAMHSPQARINVYRRDRGSIRRACAVLLAERFAQIEMMDVEIVEPLWPNS